ncbi:MAG: hypothetical protein CMO81_07845 [Waddliaceae bacterium]|nr:hypothetical protein [Waddliaceae bacterium]
MLVKKNQEAINQEIDKRIKELEIQNETLNKEMEEFERSLGIQFDQLASYAKDKENFTSEEWVFMEEYEKSLERKISCALENVIDKRKVEKARESLNIGQHWIPMR